MIELLISKSKFPGFIFYKSTSGSWTLFDILESVYTNSVKRGGMIKGQKEIEVFKSFVNRVFEFTEKGQRA